MTLIARPSPAEAVERELAIREHLWPREVHHRRATEAEAEADLAAWHNLRGWTKGTAPERDRAMELRIVLVKAEARRWAGQVPEADPNYGKRAQRILDTNAIAHAFDIWLIRRGWLRMVDTMPVDSREAA